MPLKSHETEAVIIATQIILDHLTENKSAEDLAPKTTVGPSTLKRIFREYHQMSIHEYITKMRIEKAFELLINTDMEVKMIATKIGYHKLGTFYKAFAKHSTLTPAKYRTLNK